MSSTEGEGRSKDTIFQKTNLRILTSLKYTFVLYLQTIHHTSTFTSLSNFCYIATKECPPFVPLF